MHPAIRVSIESARGCGYRSAGGIYMVCDGPGIHCGRLPIPLEKCPSCGAGVKPCRGWTWVDGDKFLAAAGPCRAMPCNPDCPLDTPWPGRVGLLWVGEKFYPLPHDFAQEACRKGISRKLKAVPKDFKLGETWVWLAHRKGISHECACRKIPRPQPWESETWACPECDGTGTYHIAAVFHAFKPSRLEVIVTGDEPDEEIDALVKRGLSPVQVIRDVEHAPLFGDPLA